MRRARARVSPRARLHPGDPVHAVTLGHAESSDNTKPASDSAPGSAPEGSTRPRHGVTITSSSGSAAAMDGDRIPSGTSADTAPPSTPYGIEYGGSAGARPLPPSSTPASGNCRTCQSGPRICANSRARPIRVSRPATPVPSDRPVRRSRSASYACRNRSPSLRSPCRHPPSLRSPCHHPPSLRSPCERRLRDRSGVRRRRRARRRDRTGTGRAGRRGPVLRTARYRARRSVAGCRRTRRRAPTGVMRPHCAPARGLATAGTCCSDRVHQAGGHVAALVE